MFKRVFILIPLILGLMLFSCSLDEPEQTETVELTFEDIAAQDVETAKSEVGNVVAMTLNLSAQAFNAHQEVVAMESNASLAKTAGEWVYAWDGTAHTWEMAIVDGPFYGDFFKKVYYADEAGEWVETAGEAHFMFSTNRAKGGYGFQGEAPDNQYGVTFNHTLNGAWINMQSADRYLSADGHYNKTNRLIYNGKDARLKYIVDITVDELFIDKENDAQNLSIKGQINIEMKPWKVVIDCDGSPKAVVTIFAGRRTVDSFDYDVSELNLADLQGMI